MRDLFPGYRRPDEAALRTLWDSALFAFDANVLLNLYRYGRKTRDDLFSSIEALEHRVRLPHRSAFEFYTNRIRVIAATMSDRDALRNDVKCFVGDVQKKYGRTPHANLEALAANILRAADDALQTDETVEGGLTGTDPIADRVEGIFSGKVTPQVTLNAELRKAADARFADEVPPGYNDKKKPGDSRYGDIIIWYELIETAKRERLPVILISDDQKDDWYLRVNGRTVGPRPELIAEMQHAAGVAYYSYPVTAFLKWSARYDDTQVSSSTLAEVDTLAEIDATERHGHSSSALTQLLRHRLEAETLRRESEAAKVALRALQMISDLRGPHSADPFGGHAYLFRTAEDFPSDDPSSDDQREGEPGDE